MSPDGATVFNSIPIESVVLDGAFDWVLLAFAVFTIGTLVGCMLALLRERTTLHSVRCPRDGRHAEVVVRRSAGGSAIGVQRCSLLSSSGDVGCSRSCVARIGC
jgi:hypothetical protein